MHIHKTSSEKTSLSNAITPSSNANIKPSIQAKGLNNKPLQPIQSKQGKKSPIQAKGFNGKPLQPIQRKHKSGANGLPDQLKTNMEQMSGVDLSDVTVQRNSDKPAEIKAEAYAQGSNIHLAPGQEQHLPHEAWHVVQQKQGRVQPTVQAKNGAHINDDPGLEREADIMGAKALNGGVKESGASQIQAINPIQNQAIIQGKFDDSKLNAEDKKAFDEKIAEVRQKNDYFEVIYQKLLSSNFTYVLQIGGISSRGGFIPNRKGGGTIAFYSQNELRDDYAFIEEFFHGYQSEHYGYESMLKKPGAKDIPGASNKEFEARFFKGLITTLDGGVSGELPGQEGLTMFIYDLLDTNDEDFSFVMNQSELTPDQKKEYLGMVENFRAYWEALNKKDGKDGVYDDTMTNEGPDASFAIIKKVIEMSKKK